MTVAALKAYMDDRGSAIASEDQATRAVELFTEYMASIKQIGAPVAFWSPSRQMECARWLRANYDHSAGYMARLFNVMRSSFIDATKIKLRADVFGIESESAMMSSAPDIIATEDKIAAELKLPKRSRRKSLSLDEMAGVLDAIRTPHLFRFAILSLCTWARPQAVIDFDPVRQADWDAAVIDLAPPDWRPTNKRRPQQPMSQCLADWLAKWIDEDAKQRAADEAAGRIPRPPHLLTYKRQRVATTKKAWRRLGQQLKIEGFTQDRFRHFMADQVKRLFRRIPREQRSRWLGHVVRDGSRTTDHYEESDPLALIDVALAVDCIMALLAERCSRSLLAIEVRLKAEHLREIGARVLPKNAIDQGDNGARDRDRTCDPYHVKVVSITGYRGKSGKKRA